MTTQNAINLNTPGIVGYNGSGTFSGSALTTNAVVYAGSADTLTSQSLINGQLQIGNTGNPPTASTLTAGTGVSIANASGSITISASGGGLAWTVVTGAAQAMAVNNGYISNFAGTLIATLPAVSAAGSIIRITGINPGNGWQVSQNAGNTIFFGTSATTLGVTGSLASTNTHDSIELLCVTANANWVVLDSVGNITVV